jgi:peptidoglycan/LPS O-acetylase OafA/YrhL
MIIFSLSPWYKFHHGRAVQRLRVPITTKAEIRPVTSLRGISAMAAVLFRFHSDFSRSFSLNACVTLLAYGYLPVDFFFVLSGFILVAALA